MIPDIYHSKAQLTPRADLSECLSKKNQNNACYTKPSNITYRDAESTKLINDGCAQQLAKNHRNKEECHP